MIRERVADDVYVFTSEIYANVNAGAIVGPDWSIVIDTLAYPEETQEIKDFIELVESSLKRIKERLTKIEDTEAENLTPCPKCGATLYCTKGCFDKAC